MNNYGYNFYFSEKSNEELVLLTFPITPGELTIKAGSKNKTITLINEGDINVLKSPSLVEVEFDARFPMKQYPFARKFTAFQTYWDKFEELKEKKTPFRFIVTRSTPNGIPTWDTNLLVALEDVELKESADEGDDVIVSFKLKQYKEYGVRTIKLPTASNPESTQNSETTSTAPTTRPDDGKTTESNTHTVKKGDCLWNIAKKYYGKGAKWKTIYEANKTVIENEAKKRGKKSSSNGHWIYPGTVLTIPSL